MLLADEHVVRPDIAVKEVFLCRHTERVTSSDQSLHNIDTLNLALLQYHSATILLNKTIE